MMHPYEHRSISRRGFARGVAAGLGVAGVPLAILAKRNYDRDRILASASITPSKPVVAELMPGKYRGRVVEVHDDHAVDERHRIDRPTVRQMMDRGMCDFTGADHPVEAWKTLFSPGEVIGIKVNPAGSNKRLQRCRPGFNRKRCSRSAHLKAIGVKPQIHCRLELCQRFVIAGYEKVMGERDGRRPLAASSRPAMQLAINGIDDPNAIRRNS